MPKAELSGRSAGPPGGRKSNFPVGRSGRRAAEKEEEDEGGGEEGAQDERSKRGKEKPNGEGYELALKRIIPWPAKLWRDRPVLNGLDGQLIHSPWQEKR